MLTLLICGFICWIGLKLALELIKISGALIAFVGTLVLIPLIIIGTFSGELLSAFGFIVLIALIILLLSTII